jgi:hypothetical protein
MLIDDVMDVHENEIAYLILSLAFFLLNLSVDRPPQKTQFLFFGFFFFFFLV